MPVKTSHPLYSVWQGMRHRCFSPTAKAYPDYGGRGISVCPEWDSFQKFVEDMGPRPDGHSIDRINNDGNYEPSNCRWATRSEQQLNRRAAVFVTIDGVRHRVALLAKQSGLKPDTIMARARAGLSYTEVMDPQRRTQNYDWRAAVKQRVANQKAATHCKNGHKWTPENTRITKEGWRSCRACHAAKMRRRYAAKAR